MRDPPFTTVRSAGSPISGADVKTHSFMADSLRRKRVHNGPVSSFGVSLTSRLGPTPFSITANISCAFLECIMTVVTPAAVASSAAINFVDMPPVPRDVPRVAVDTVQVISILICQSHQRIGGLGLTLTFYLFYIANNPHRLGVGITPRIIGIQAFDVREQEQVVGMYDCRRDC